MSNLLNLYCCIHFYTVHLHRLMCKICSRIISTILVVLIWLFVNTHSAALSLDNNMTQESHGFRCCSLLVVWCTLCSSESCSGLCSDVPPAPICSQLSRPCGALLEFFWKLKTPEDTSRKCRLLGQFVWTWDLVWKEGFPACCLLGSHPGCTGRASPALQHQPADAFLWKCWFGLPCVWISPRSLSGAGVQPCGAWISVQREKGIRNGKGFSLSL